MLWQVHPARRPVMSLKPDPIQPVPEETARVARAAFRKGNPLLKLRDELGAIFADEDFADLFPKRGQPGLAPWRLALVTLLQFREDLPDRLLARCRELGHVKARGRQRSDTTHVLAAVRLLNRLELVGETLRAALNELATVAPDWLRAAPRAWYERYALRVEDGRLPRTAAGREAYARTVGEDGFALLGRLDEPATPEELRRLPQVEVLRQVWARHFVREGGAPPGEGVRLRAKDEPPP